MRSMDQTRLSDNWQISPPQDEEIAEVLQSMHSLTNSAKAFVLVEELPTVRGDRCQLSRLFQNLIANAIKYSKSDQREVQLHARRKDRHWIISVSDKGPGIEESDLCRTFLPFHRGARTSSIPGTGMGLSICKKIVEMHGGEIWVDLRRRAEQHFHFHCQR